MNERMNAHVVFLKSSKEGCAFAESPIQLSLVFLSNWHDFLFLSKLLRLRTLGALYDVGNATGLLIGELPWCQDCNNSRS